MKHLVHHHMISDIKYTQFFALCTIIVAVYQENVCSEKVAIQKENYEPDYSFYHNLTSIVSHMAEIVKKYGEYIKRSDEFMSKSGHPQLLIRITNFTSEKSGVNKVRILFAFGEHAREFFPVESMFFFLTNVTRGLDKFHGSTLEHDFSAWVLNNFDIYIIGITNPDGREYLERTKNYCWRGTAVGIDLNRNFDWNYAGAGSSNDSEDEEFRGSKPFSEPETQVFTVLSSTVPFDAFLSFHSGIRHIYLPFADTKSKQQNRLPDNINHMLRLARRMSDSSPTRPFKFGVAYQLINYTADGTSFDYMAGTALVPFSLAVELWEHEHHTGTSCFDEFNPRSEFLQDEVALVHPLYVELLTYLFTWKMKSVTTEKQMLPMLVRVKKDGSPDLQQHDLIYASETSTEIGPNASVEIQVLCAIFALVAVLCVIFGVRHMCQVMRRKRVVSLKSLSLTFSLYKQL